MANSVHIMAALQTEGDSPVTKAYAHRQTTTTKSRHRLDAGEKPKKNKQALNKTNTTETCSPLTERM